MSLFRIRTNLGMGAAFLLLVIGASIVIAADAHTTLHTAGIGILVLASIVYLGARAYMMFQDRAR